MSSPLDKAEAAVEEAWSDAFVFQSKESLDALVDAVEARCAERALAELLTDDTGDPTDEAYNRGVRDAARAIREQP